MSRLDYLKRIFLAYLTKKPSQLTFWHGIPDVNPNANYEELGEYYQLFDYKADYDDYFDGKGVILLDYQGEIGKQYYPIAIAQYGLACFNRYKRTGDKTWLEKARVQGDWLVDHLVQNGKGCYLWYANFDWEYRELLKAPWPSALAQGNGISLLLRLYQETKDKRYLETSEKAYHGLTTEIKNGGVAFIDEKGNLWLEEYIVEPPTHILNGFMWTIMGVYDYFLITKNKTVKDLLENCLRTLERNMYKFDSGYWSLYDLSETKIKNLASLFYHKLHIAQLDILYKMSSVQIFKEYKNKWKIHLGNNFGRMKALFLKLIFKSVYF